MRSSISARVCRALLATQAVVESSYSSHRLLSHGNLFGWALFVREVCVCLFADALLAGAQCPDERRAGSAEHFQRRQQPCLQKMLRRDSYALGERQPIVKIRHQPHARHLEMECHVRQVFKGALRILLEFESKDLAIER